MTDTKIIEAMLFMAIMPTVPAYLKEIKENWDECHSCTIIWLTILGTILFVSLA